MQGEIERREGKLAAIIDAGGGQFGVVHFLDGLRRNFLRRIAIIGGESVENFFVPDPVLQHLRRRFDEIARHIGAGEAAIFRARHDRVQRVAEFVEERFHVAVRHERGFVRARAAGNCKAARTVGPLIFSVRHQLAADDFELARSD